MIRLIIQPNAQLAPKLRKQLLDLYNRFFPRRRPQPRRTSVGFDASQKNRVRFILVDDHQLISHAAVLTKYLIHAGNKYKLAGLGGVLTHPQFQNQGHGTQIVKEATEYIDSKNFDIAVLFCDKKRKAFYERHGWQILANDTITVGKHKRHAQSQNETTMIRFISKRAIANTESFEKEPIFFGESW